MNIDTIIPGPFRIEFTPCTGFGNAGRTASIYLLDGSATPFYGHGETDEEAVLEALVGGGIEFDRASDLYGPVLRNAKQITRLTLDGQFSFERS